MKLPRVRFSLAGLLLSIAVIGASLACILNFGLSIRMVTVLWSLLLLILMVTPVLALIGVTHRRPFYAGFAWFGWMYILLLLMGMISQTANLYAPSLPTAYPQIAIENGMFMLYQHVIPRESWILNGSPRRFQDISGSYDSHIRTPAPPAPASGMGGAGPSLPAVAPGTGGFFPGVSPPSPAQTRPIRVIPWGVFRDIGHAFLTVVAGILGGCFVVFLRRRNLPIDRESHT
jgi:hypothetical protein